MREKDVLHRGQIAREMVPRMLTMRAFLDEMQRPAGRFKTPLSWRDRVRLAFNRFALPRLIIKDLPLYLEAGLPLNWQIVVNYLYKEGISETPGISIPPLRNDKPMLHQMALRGHYDAATTDAPNRTFLGYGTSSDFEERISKSIGEFLERYFGTIYKKDAYLRASAAALTSARRTFLSPDVCTAFSSEQRERAPDFQFDNHTRFRWLEAEELVSGKRALVPAQLMYWLYDRTIEKEPLLSPINSNGLAGHFTREEALISAIRECIERDGFLAYWMQTLSPRVVAIEESTDARVHEALRVLARFNMRAYVLDTTTDIGIPTSACVIVHDEAGTPFVSVGAASGSSAVDSFLNSLREALVVQTGAAEKRGSVKIGTDYIPFADRTIGMEERVHIWYGKEMYERARFLFSGARESLEEFNARFLHYDSPQRELEAIVERMRALGHEIYVREAKHRTLERVGYHVAKVFIPQLLPMYLHEHEAVLGKARLHELPKKLGYDRAQLNTDPHPFP